MLIGQQGKGNLMSNDRLAGRCILAPNDTHAADHAVNLMIIG